MSKKTAWFIWIYIFLSIVTFVAFYFISNWDVTDSYKDASLKECIEQLKSSGRTFLVGDRLVSFGKEAVPELINVLQDDTQYVNKFEIILLLGRIGDKSAAPHLVWMIKRRKEPQSVLRTSLLALIEIGDKNAIPDLIEVLEKEKDSSFGQSIIYTLRFLSDGQDFGTDAAKWREWWEKNKERLLKKESKKKAQAQKQKINVSSIKMEHEKKTDNPKAIINPSEGNWVAISFKYSNKNKALQKDSFLTKGHMPWRDDPVMVTKSLLSGFNLIENADAKDWITKEIGMNKIVVIVLDKRIKYKIKYRVFLQKQEWGAYTATSIIQEFINN